MDGRVGQPPEGARQLGNYRLLNLLGQGSFAEVYLGEHIYLPTKAAIKLLYARVTKDEVAIFQQEARTLAQLVHPNIVRVLDFGVQTSTNTPYLVMDYAPGGTLRQHYPKGTRLPLSVVVEYVKQVAAALQYGHDKKFIHRDIKPENILLGDNGELLLSDFGIALFTQNSRYQSSQDMLDTIAYMAPEQIRGRPEQASDQYALAVMVYEWLCGKLPFREG
ncbi:MAG TPA: serine/threonine-protein kinase, partial [Ktedonobacteraceae bacterium]|nr:serine/threonine-protein kinase [Ktedonobacteraceae bacterium]